MRFGIDKQTKEVKRIDLITSVENVKDDGENDAPAMTLFGTRYAIGAPVFSGEIRSTLTLEEEKARLEGKYVVSRKADTAYDREEILERFDLLGEGQTPFAYRHRTTGDLITVMLWDNKHLFAMLGFTGMDKSLVLLELSEYLDILAEGFTVHYKDEKGKRQGVTVKKGEYLASVHEVCPCGCGRETTTFAKLTQTELLMDYEQVAIL